MKKRDRKFFSRLFLIILILCLYGCNTDVETNNMENPAIKQSSEAEELINELMEMDSEELTKEQEKVMTENREKMLNIGREIKALDDISGIDETVILVDDYPITRKTFEVQRIYTKYIKNTTLKEAIEEIIKNTAIKAEAERLNIQPSEEKIDAYIESVDSTLREDVTGAEIDIALIEGLGITREEYILQQREIAYNMYQREALWLSVEDSQKDKDYDQYMDEIAKKADVEILDEEISTILSR